MSPIRPIIPHAYPADNSRVAEREGRTMGVKWGTQREVGHTDYSKIILAVRGQGCYPEGSTSERESK